MQNKERATVIIPTYNYANYITNAIESILNQSYPNDLIEIIIIDDGSTDNTYDILKPYIEKRKIIYHYQENKGKAYATQKGIDLSSGEIIFNLDADDYFYPSKIEKVINTFIKYPNVTHVGHPADFLNKDKIQTSENIDNNFLNKPIIGNELLLTFLTKRLLFGGGSTFSARAITLKNIKIPTGIDMYIDEYLIYATAIFGASYLLSEPLSVWRIHGKNYSVDKSEEILKEKNQRLLSSSEAMLSFISNSNLFTQQIVQLYELKHIDRLYSSKEQHNEKSVSDILKLLYKIKSFRYSISDLHTYRIFYRLIPNSIINILKRR